MGKFGGASLRSELGKAGSFALLAFAASHGSQWVSSRFEHAPALVVEIAVSLIVAFIGFVAYNAVFARPRLVATWSPSKQDDECDSNPLVQPANRGCIYVVRLNLIATSHIGALALLTVTRMGLLASIRLDHTEYVKLVREGNSRRGNGKGVRALRAGPRGDGLKCEWTRTPECWALHSTFLVALDRRFLRVRGKGRKERLAGLSPVLLDELLPELRSGNVVTAGGRTYTADALQRRVSRHLTSLGMDSTFHKLRARYVTQGIAETGDIYAVARAAGWASIETAKHYAALSDDSLHRIAAAASK